MAKYLLMLQLFFIFHFQWQLAALKIVFLILHLLPWNWIEF